VIGEERAARRLVTEVWNHLDATAAADLVAPECPGLGGAGPAAVLAWHRDRRTTFPDLRYDLTDLVAAPGRAVVRWRASGSQRGAFGPIAATGRTVEYSGATFLTFDDSGRVVDVWSVNELFQLVQQLGAEIVPPEQPAQ
jgi:hypothetical protein